MLGTAKAPFGLSWESERTSYILKGIGEAYYVANLFETSNIPTTGQSSDYSSFKDIVARGPKELLNKCYVF